MAKAVYLMGGGGHGRIVLDTLLASGVKVAGVLDSDLKVGDQVFGVPVIGGDDFVDRVDPSAVFLVNGLGANPHVRSRQKLFEKFRARDFLFNAIQHPSAVIGRECDLGEGSQIMAGAVLQNRVRIGENAVVNTRASIDHNCVIGAHAFISPGAVFCGDVMLAASAFIGSGAVLLPCVQIGADAIVGAGAIVTKNIPARWIVAGNPAIKIGVNE
jgi:UDP-perosamine 4-acetyltransferase